MNKEHAQAFMELSQWCEKHQAAFRVKEGAPNMLEIWFSGEYPKAYHVGNFDRVRSTVLTEQRYSFVNAKS